MIKIIFYIIFYAGYLFTCLTALISPGYLDILVLLSIGIMPYTFAVFVFGLLQVIFNEKRWIKILALTMCLLALFQTSKVFELTNSSDLGDIKVMSFNASFFRVPSVFSPEYFNPTKPTINEQMVNWILDQKADILCFQEFFDDSGLTEYNNLELIAKMGGYDHYFQRKSLHDNGVSRGIVIFSRAPILSEELILLDENRFNGSICIKVLMGQDTIQIVNTHLKSSMLGFKEDMKSLAGIKNNLSRLRHDARIKGEQVDNLIQYLSNNPYPTIICGDFNSTRHSYVYNELNRHFENAFNNAGFGFGFSYNGRIKLPLKIDHQFYSHQFEAKSCIVDKSMPYSDHLPVIATYNLVGN